MYHSLTYKLQCIITIIRAVNRSCRQSPKVEIKHQDEDSAKMKVTKTRHPRTSKSSAVNSTVVSSPRKQTKRGRPSKQVGVVQLHVCNILYVMHDVF